MIVAEINSLEKKDKKPGLAPSGLVVKSQALSSMQGAICIGFSAGSGSEDTIRQQYKVYRCIIIIALPGYVANAMQLHHGHACAFYFCWRSGCNPRGIPRTFPAAARVK